MKILLELVINSKLFQSIIDCKAYHFSFCCNTFVQYKFFSTSFYLSFNVSLTHFYSHYFVVAFICQLFFSIATGKTGFFMTTIKQEKKNTINTK